MGKIGTQSHAVHAISHQQRKTGTPMKTNYLLTWSCQRMNMYLHGLEHFSIETGHKPLVPILNSKQLTEMSPRIQSMRLKLLKYSFTASHVPGKDADALSRAPHEQPSKVDTAIDEEISYHINEVIKNLPTSNSYLDILGQNQKKFCNRPRNTATMKTNDDRMAASKSIQSYWDSRHELTMVNGIMIIGRRVVVSKSQQKTTLEKLHNAHQGIDRMKRRARQCVYWPSLNKMIEETINECRVFEIQTAKITRTT